MYIFTHTHTHAQNSKRTKHLKSASSTFPAGKNISYPKIFNSAMSWVVRREFIVITLFFPLTHRTWNRAQKSFLYSPHPVITKSGQKKEKWNTKAPKSPVKIPMRCNICPSTNAAAAAQMVSSGLGGSPEMNNGLDMTYFTVYFGRCTHSHTHADTHTHRQKIRATEISWWPSTAKCSRWVFFLLFFPFFFYKMCEVHWQKN